MLDHADYMDPTLQHELHSTRSGTDRPWKDLDHELEVDDLSEMCNLIRWIPT